METNGSLVLADIERIPIARRNSASRFRSGFPRATIQPELWHSRSCRTKSGSNRQYPALQFMPDTASLTAKQTRFGRTPLNGLYLEPVEDLKALIFAEG